jgi:sulfide:quinone oxidoreductase
MVTDLLSERNIEYNPSQKVKEIRSGTLLTENGKEFSQTLTIAIPLHVSPSVIKDAGLVDQSGWIPVNSKTLATAHAHVYAIGDCAGTKNSKGQLIPRAGVLAEGQGKVVASNLIQEIRGGQSRLEFDGKGVCFMETGGGNAAPVRANFYAEPVATWEFVPPSPDGLQAKQKFLEERMNAWFG